MDGWDGEKQEGWVHSAGVWTILQVVSPVPSKRIIIVSPGLRHCVALARCENL
jgi:hypothetical protein